MLGHSHLLNPVLINTVGHTAGILLFGFIIILITRDWRNFGVRQTRLSLLAAYLALGWNAGSLTALASNSRGPVFVGLVMTASFAILSLLPAVLLQVVLPSGHRQIVVAGYVVSSVAVLLHCAELFFPSLVLHHLSLLVIAVGFAFLTALTLVTRQKRFRNRSAHRQEWILLGALFLFTSSFLHFGYEHVSSPWAAEIAWHHIGIPVALIVLLQDYRFLLLDTFVRFLINAGLAATYLAIFLTLGQHIALSHAMQSSTFLTGIALVAACLSLILFAHIKNLVHSSVSRKLFLRRDLDECMSRIANVASSAQSEGELLARTAKEVADHLKAEDFVILDEAANNHRFEKPSVTYLEPSETGTAPRLFRAEAQIPLRFSSGEIRYLVAGTRRGGRRYLSEDLEDMRRLGSSIVEQVERFRAEELKRLVSQAELRALQAQINPHFLFNALNTLYGIIDRQSYEARRMVLNLADVFRYLLGGERAMIQLSEEVRIVQAYLEIEALRLGDRLQTEILMSESARSTMIPVLSIQPLVENAVKHGVAAKGGPGRVCLKAEKTSDGLRVSVEDTGVGFKSSAGKYPGGLGLGLENVRRRLILSFGLGSDLKIHSSDAGTCVMFFIPDSARKGAANCNVEVRA